MYGPLTPQALGPLRLNERPVSDEQLSSLIVLTKRIVEFGRAGAQGHLNVTHTKIRNDIYLLAGAFRWSRLRPLVLFFSFIIIHGGAA